MYRLAQKQASDKGQWKEPLAEGQLPLAAKQGCVEFAGSLSLGQILEDALTVLEDEQQPAYVRHTARLICGAIYELYCLGVNPQDPRLWVTAVVGGFYERMRVEQHQHHALEGRKVIGRRKGGGHALKKKNESDRRRRQYLKLKESTNDAKWEICRRIAEKEIRRKKGEGYQAWQTRIGTLRKTIYREIEGQLKKRADHSVSSAKVNPS